MSTPHNFDVLKAIAERKGQVLMCGLSSIVRMQKTKLGAQVTIGVPEYVMAGIANGKYVGGLILADKQEFEAEKEQQSKRGAA